ncbi:MAG: hypothetical protein HUU01_16610 [Saprospiraceae bacterium]|nr:hypothetical protein [Saprospiraceae bacterium]
MKQLTAILSFFICTNSIFSQNIYLSNGIGAVNCKYSYAQLTKALGAPDSTHTFDPKNLNPVPKSLAYNNLYYDNNLLVVSFFYFMLDTLTKKTRGPIIELYHGSSITLNGDALSDLDSAYVLKKYGSPKSMLSTDGEMTISYSFRKKKYFSLLTFYYHRNGSLNKIRISFGKYL